MRCRTQVSGRLCSCQRPAINQASLHPSILLSFTALTHILTHTSSTTSPLSYTSVSFSSSYSSVFFSCFSSSAVSNPASILPPLLLPQAQISFSFSSSFLSPRADWGEGRRSSGGRGKEPLLFFRAWCQMRHSLCWCWKVNVTCERRRREETRQIGRPEPPGLWNSAGNADLTRDTKLIFNDQTQEQLC